MLSVPFRPSPRLHHSCCMWRKPGPTPKCGGVRCLRLDQRSWPRRCDYARGAVRDSTRNVPWHRIATASIVGRRRVSSPIFAVVRATIRLKRFEDRRQETGRRRPPSVRIASSRRGLPALNRRQPLPTACSPPASRLEAQRGDARCSRSAKGTSCAASAATSARRGHAAAAPKPHRAQPDSTSRPQRSGDSCDPVLHVRRRRATARFVRTRADAPRRPRSTVNGQVDRIGLP